MQTIPTSPLPLSIPKPRFRPPKKNIPQTKIERDHLKDAVREYVEKVNPVPPMPTDELKAHAMKILEAEKMDQIYRDYVGILVNNEMWKETLAAIPFERRLLLIPKCLRIESKCPAPFDEFGLLCKQCGLCSIQDLQNEAERLGYAVLVAEGSAIVMSLIETGKIEAIVGVSCISVLERAFPYMEAAAIPGVAIPLLQDDCIDTTVDLDWIWDTIHLTSDDHTRRLDLSGVQEQVDSWFSSEELEKIMGPAEGRVDEIARDWLGRAGKRWRPFLTVSTFQALRDQMNDPLPFDLRRVAVAVECFHKASLIHDDIEDEDKTRYGEKTLHEEHGVPVALNIGDLLIGEGYRMIAESTSDPSTRSELLKVAAEGQRCLCLGQGMELGWAADPSPLKSRQVIEIFRQKTAPAFEVALKMGAVYSGKHEQVNEVLESFSKALGIAYQIRDDLEDIGSQAESDDIQGLRLNILLGIAYEKASQEDQKALLESLWKRCPDREITSDQIKSLYIELKAVDRARHLLESYKEEAIGSLRDLENAGLKGLLRRVMGKIFNDTEIKGWCHEFEARNLPEKNLEKVAV